MATVVPLKTASTAATVRSAADRYLDSITVVNTRRAYTTALGKVVPELGEARPLSAVADDEIGQPSRSSGAPPPPHLERPARRGRRLARLVPRQELDAAAHPGLVQADARTRLRDPGPLQDRHRPPDRAPRRRPAREDHLPDALRDHRPRRRTARHQHRGPQPRRPPGPGEGQGRKAVRRRARPERTTPPRRSTGTLAPPASSPA
ncbi:hypothetical protein ACFPK5_01070 [Streptomyces beijiangensis]|uniref:hypothetical protein n=1 Tax=Streptomyces beijiangensis TaxID=163361 RepID=UPI003612DBA8